MRQIDVTANEAGQRLDKLLAKYLNQASKSFLYKMLRKKNIVLNEKKANGNEKLVQGDEIKIYLAEETILKFSVNRLDLVKSDLNIIYEDKHILLINKEVGMLSQKAKPDDISLVEHIISYMLETDAITKEALQSFRPSISNRLDRNTSGIVVAGKSLVGLQTMAHILKDRSIHKYYRCIVPGIITKKQQIEGFLVKDEKNNKVYISQREERDSLPIKTEYTPISTSLEMTFLEAKLITGRSHQIRAHLASIGHPIVGDTKYGDRSVNQRFAKEFNLSCQLLHSYRLVMPTIEGELSYLSNREYVAKEPELFQEILQALKLHVPV